MRPSPSRFLLLITCISVILSSTAQQVYSQGAAIGDYKIYFPGIMNQVLPPGEWPQLGHDPQRTNATDEQVNPPFCYAWKWYQAPIASRAQPVVANNLIFIGGMDGVLYARNAKTGAPAWQFASKGPIRNSAGVLGRTVIFSSHDGFTYGLNTSNGSLLWKIQTGPSATAPLLDDSRGWVYVASTKGTLEALNVVNIHT